MLIRPLIVIGSVGLGALLLGGTLHLLFFADYAFPDAPAPGRTLTPRTRPAPLEIGSYDMLGRTVGKDAARKLLDTEDGRRELDPANGAVKLTSELVNLGRRAFYEETFGNEVFLTDVVGVLDGPINPRTLARAIAGLHGQATTNLQVLLEEDTIIGSRVFRQGTWVSTGLDVPEGSAVPLGMRVFLKAGRLRVGMTCAACHAAVDPATEQIVEGAPNADVNAGLLLAFASNSAAFFRQTGVDPRDFPAGRRTYVTAKGETRPLPDGKTFEDAVDAALLAWPPGNFDSTGDLQNNPTQIPTAYTFDAWPYGWSGFANIGWFHGLTTLNANVHGTNSDLITGADSSEALLGIPKDRYLAVILQRAARPGFRPPPGEPPSRFLERNDPTPGAPSLNWAVKMPGYPLGSPFILDGLLPATPGHAAGAEINGLSAFQNTLAPPPQSSASLAGLQRGADIFARAGCAGCHAGRRFTNHRVLPQPEIGTEPSRARALAAFPRIFGPPLTYSPDTPVPVPPNAPTLAVPKEITAEADRRRAYARDDPAGGYKVPSLVGLAVSAPYLHDGGVAAAAGALRHEGDAIVLANSHRLGPAGTAFRGLPADPASSLYFLLDRNLRRQLVEANRADGRLQQAHVDGSGHESWVDPEAGYSPAQQADLIDFLLSLDDDPAVLPPSSPRAAAAGSPGKSAPRSRSLAAFKPVPAASIPRRGRYPGRTATHATAFSLGQLPPSVTTAERGR